MTCEKQAVLGARSSRLFRPRLAHYTAGQLAVWTDPWAPAIVRHHPSNPHSDRARMKLLTELFAWWTGNTIGTRLYTWRYGSRVGSDAFGNVYYQTEHGKRRWVIYRDQAEASLVPPDWHGWLHYTVDVPPSEETYQPRPWQTRCVPNLTGTPQAYRPPGSILNPDAGKSPPLDYEPWRPS